MNASEPPGHSYLSGVDSAVTAAVSWRPDKVRARLRDADLKYSTTIDRDGREIEALLDWLARSPETPSHVDLDLHEEEPTHEQLVDRLSRAGWQLAVTRYVFPGRRSAVHNGISVRIWIAGAGWLRGEFSAGGQTVSLEASSVLDNGWEDLLDALSDLVSGNTTSEARWWEEPYYAHFRFTKADPDHVRLVIVRENYNEDLREVVERVLLDATVSLRGIAAAVAETSRALLDGYPHAELGDIWRTEAFLPIASQNRLEKALLLLPGSD